MELQALRNSLESTGLVAKIQDLDMGSILNIEPVKVEASNRRYYRIALSGFPQTVILCDGLGKPYNDEDHFVEISTWLRKRGYPCSEILLNDSLNGRLILKDAGQDDLSTLLSNWEPPADSEKRIGLTQRALDLLKPLHQFEAPPVIADRFFDETKLKWEMDFLFKQMEDVCHFLGKKNPLTYESKYFLYKICIKLAQTEDLVICHRDYHGRNILISGESPKYEQTIIDFQDARMGLVVYDAVSLIYDPYTPFTMQERQTLKSYFESKLSPKHQKYKSFFYVQAMQRLMKALGTYLNQIFVKNHMGYLKSIQPTILNLTEIVQLGHLPDCLFLFLNQFSNEIAPHLEKVSGKSKGI